ncbi:hypothetical protein FNV43_RR00566 [Rhamnella rubrinervis]|uniref:Uncharacterized protein n=1 Tax=Rhamnella rubrinervis TaxID=2594499 RepID=A0A8K0HQW4_9ROSA|nr:hypothetical protein FNV43_RR00566 [Rhamnella rubrinervis]
MAETAVGFVLNYLTPLLTEEANLLGSVHSEVLAIKLELESIQCFLKDADKKAESEENTSHGVKVWVKQLREVSFRIEDVVDEYIFYLAQHPRRQSGFFDSVYKFAGCVAKLKPRHRISTQIRILKKEVCEISERSTRYRFHTLGERSATTHTDVSWYDPRKAAIYLEEAEVVGIESQKAKLSGWLLDEKQSQRTVISVVGMGGLGKTTLAKQVYDSVKDNFDCHAWIAVSQSYQKEDVLKNVIKKFCEGREEPIPEGIEAMDEEALTKKLREYLRQKRYVVSFDDVWNDNFWGDIEHALLDHGNGARIMITSRKMNVTDFCKISASVYVHEMQHLQPEKARELFYKRVFKSEEESQCPADLLKLSDKIVDKCHGVPLAIVAIAGLLSTKTKTVDEWTKLHDSLSSELVDDPYLKSITKILSLSYNDLPHHLKSCFMYFAMYPEDYSIRCSRIIQQWIAEGFVEEKKNKTLEEVASKYLTELINRSLVQISRFHHITGKVRDCRVHDLMREVVVRKMEDSSFCHVISGNESTFRGLITRRLSFVQSSFDVLHNADQICQVRSVLNFNTGDGILLDMSILITQTKNFKLLKLLDFEDGPLTHVHEDVGNLFHLRYLSLRNTKVEMLPRSIGKLVNLETLDLKHSLVFELPGEIYRLCKLRHLLGYNRDYASFGIDWTKGIKIKAGIGCLKFLQKLYLVEINEIGVIKELGKLTQLRKLGIFKLGREDGKILCQCIEKMELLETLEVTAMSEDDFIDLEYMSSPPKYIRSLWLKGRLRKLPEWITKLRNLSRIGINWSKLRDDPLEILKRQHNLVELHIEDNAYDGEKLQFEDGVFPRLKTLRLRNLSGLSSIIIEERALSNLEQLYLGPSPHMKEVPLGICHLKTLKDLKVFEMPDEFLDDMRSEVVEHIPFRCRF